MSVLINENELPQDLDGRRRRRSGVCSELAEVASSCSRGLPALVECDKDLAPFLYPTVRNRLSQPTCRCLYLDGRPRQEEQRQPADAAWA